MKVKAEIEIPGQFRSGGLSGRRRRCNRGQPKEGPEVGFQGELWISSLEA